MLPDKRVRTIDQFVGEVRGHVGKEGVTAEATLLAMVISRPSRIQAMPRAVTILVWNRDHGSRSIRAGIRLRIAGCWPYRTLLS